MAPTATATTPVTSAAGTARPRRSAAARRQAGAGWLFTAPALVLVLVFVAAPVLMAAWVSLSDWRGRGSPFAAGTPFVGLDNYRTLLAGGGLATQDLGTALRNNLWYVVLVVPAQTALSLLLALAVNRRALRGRGFFRTAFYFPSVTSSVAVVVVFLFLFSASGAVNQALGWLGINGPNWFADPDGVLHLLLGALGLGSAPAALAGHGFLGISWWSWFAGPSVAMSALIVLAVFTTSGTFMLLFLAALQSISGEVQEAAMMDGAGAGRRFFSVTLPMLRPTVFTVLTLGLVGTWQVFDQIYVGTQGGPAKTTITPAYLSYTASFANQQWGQGAAIAFILFFIIVVLTLLQRSVLAEREPRARRRRPPAVAADERAPEVRR